MRFKTYEKYKDSKNLWIGDIPLEWDVIKAKHCFSISGGYAFKSNDFVDNGCYLVRIGDITNGKINLNTCKKLPLDFAYIFKDYLISDGDILIALTGDIGKMGKVPKTEYKLLLNQRVGKLNSDFPDYFKYVIDSSFFKTQMNLISFGTAQENISTENIGNCYILDISNEEKEKIANYLDRKTSEIDEKIAKNKELISLFEEKKTVLINHAVTKGLDPNVHMNDSRIEWIGEIPEHWKVKKVKEISSVTPSNVDKKTKDNEPSVLLCNYTDVYNNEFITNDLDFMKATASHEQIRKLSLNKGDIIITKDSETAEDIGVPAIVTEDLDNVVCGYHLTVIKPDDSIYNKFLFRCFESKKVNDQFVIAANGITRFGLSVYPIANSYVCIPPYEEQKEISTFLEKEISNIYKIIETIEKEIFLLKEYKDSLVHHVVTGKIDVRKETMGID